MSKALVLSVVLLLSGCRYFPIETPQTALCPPLPELPKITAAELSALSDASYQKLVDRELLLKAHIRLLSIHCPQP